MLHFFHDTLHINHSLCQKLCTEDYLLYLLEHICVMPQRTGRKEKTDSCPDVGQSRHVFAFIFWNLCCKVAMLVQDISQITLPNHLLVSLFLFDQNLPSHICLILIHMSCTSFPLPYSVCLCRTTPVIQVLARANMHSITTAHPTLHPT